MAQTLDYVSDWAARLRSRLYTQFRDLLTWQQWCDIVLGPQFQDLENSAQTLLTLMSIDGSSGVQLDTIGRMIGQPRLGVDDPTYRLYLKARILANRSTGTTEELYSVFLALFGSSSRLYYLPGWVKQFALRIGAIALTRTQALLAASFLQDAKETGARGILEWQEFTDDQMFTFAYDPTGAFISSSMASSMTTTDTTMVMASDVTSLFAGASYFTVSPSTANEERIYTTAATTMTYDGGTFHTTITNLTRAATPHTHAPGDTVVATLGTGLGFDDGYFAGAIQA